MAERVDMDGVTGPALSVRLADELQASLRRKPVQEARLGGALRSLVGHSERLAEASAAALDVLVRRGSLDRPIYSGLLWGLVEIQDPRVVVPLLRALNHDDGGGLVTISAAAFSKEPALREPLARLAQSRSSPVAFAAELARAVRGESGGEALLTTAPRIKESSRIELLSHVVLPQVRAKHNLPGFPAASAVLRDTERHLGRWLCLAEAARACGDETPVVQAATLAREGASTARAAWSLLAWALAPKGTPCETRPTLELVARLSDRPSAERELSFLFRMAEDKQPAARPMLEGLSKQSGLETEAAVRASTYLIRDHGRTDLLRRLLDMAKGAKREPLRGLALAALYDLDPQLVKGLTLDLDRSRQLQTAAWSALVRLALSEGSSLPLVTEVRCRRLQFGWPD